MNSALSRRTLLVLAPLALLSGGAGIAVATASRPGGAGISVAAASGPGGPESRPSATKYSVDIAAVYDAHGDPAMYANFSPNGGLAKPTWWMCPPARPTVCSRTSPDRGFVQPGPTPPGTVFEARVFYRGTTYVGRTATWLGRLQATSPPRVTGRARYGDRITPHAGTWAGGWKPQPGYRVPEGNTSGGRAPDFDVLNVEACRTRTAHGCVNLSPQGKVKAFSSRPPKVGASVTGRYLIAFDQRSSPDQAIAGVGYSNPADIPTVTAGPTISRSAAFGPIVGPPAPRVSILSRTVARSGRVAVALVHCSVRCHVLAFVSGKKSENRVRTVLRGRKLISINARGLRRGPLQVQLSVGDGPLIRGTVVLR